MTAFPSASTPRWLQWVRHVRGGYISFDDAELLYRGRISWDEHHAWCVAGDLPALLAHLELEDHPIERECFYIGSFHMSYRDHPDVAIEIAKRYIEEFSRVPFPFSPGSKPDHKILKQLAILYGYEGKFDLAIRACQVALAFGITDDGTKKGFAGRIVKLQNAKKRSI